MPRRAGLPTALPQQQPAPLGALVGAPQGRGSSLQPRSCFLLHGFNLKRLLPWSSCVRRAFNEEIFHLT